LTGNHLASLPIKDEDMHAWCFCLVASQSLLESATSAFMWLSNPDLFPDRSDRIIN
jgi:hypothetical protein